MGGGFVFCNGTPEVNRGGGAVIYSTFHLYTHEHLLKVNLYIYHKLFYYVRSYFFIHWPASWY